MCIFELILKPKEIRMSEPPLKSRLHPESTKERTRKSSIFHQTTNKAKLVRSKLNSSNK